MGNKYNPVVLIVDDSNLSRKSIESVLGSDEYTLLMAEDGFEALRLADEAHPDLILLDVMMPGIDGFEVCRKIRQSPKLEAIPLLMITAMDDRASRLKGMEAGADDFIAKPFDRTLLKTRVQTITRLNRYRRMLRERTRFEWVIEHAADGYAVISQNDEIEYINTRGAELLRFPDGASVTGKNLFDLIQNNFTLEPKEAWENWPRTMIDSPNAVRFIIKPESGTEHSKWVQVTCLDVPQYATDPIVLILKDVSQFINEQRITWSFHGMMSHKLRTPLNIINSSMELFQPDSLDEDNTKIYQMFKDGVKRLDNDLNEILEFIDSPFKEHVLNYITLEDLREIVQQSAASLGIQTPELIAETVGAEDRYPIGKKAARAIVMELFSNAKKFHPRHTPSLSVVSKKEDDVLCLRIIDDGIHLSEETQKKAWMPYYQGEKFFTGQLDGMGLGLSMVATIMWEINGGFRIRNRVGKTGVEIALSFPLVESMVLS